MEVISNSFHSDLQEEHSEQQHSGMVIKYHNEFPFTFFIFSEMTKAVCEERDMHAPTDESHSQCVVPYGSSEQELWQNHVSYNKNLASEDILKYAKVTRVCLDACNLQGKQKLHCYTKWSTSPTFLKVTTITYI